jgi:hypothetical protein
VLLVLKRPDTLCKRNSVHTVSTATYCSFCAELHVKPSQCARVLLSPAPPVPLPAMQPPAARLTQQRRTPLTQPSVRAMVQRWLRRHPICLARASVLVPSLPRLPLPQLPSIPPALCLQPPPPSRPLACSSRSSQQRHPSHLQRQQPRTIRELL